MDGSGYPILSDQALYDVKTIIENAGTGSTTSRSRIVTTLGILVDNLSRSTNSDELSLLKTINLLLQVCVSDEENLSGCNSEQAVKLLKISSGFLERNVRSFDSTADTLCHIVYLCLVLMTSKDLARNASELILKCEDSLSFYLASENQQTDRFDPQIALHLLSVVLGALCRTEALFSTGTDNVPSLNHLSISHALVVQLALCNNDSLRAQSLITLIPNILKWERGNVILEKLLDAFAFENEESLNRALAALSALCIYYFPNVDSNVTCCVEGKNAVWVLIQEGLCSDSPLTRKHALFLIRKCVSGLVSKEKAVSCDMFFWVSNQKEKLFKWWQDICTVLEVLEERAIHLITPVLSILQNVFSASVEEDSAHPCFLTWCLAVFRRLLRHSCIHAVLWGVNCLIGDIGCNLISSKHAKIFYPFFLETLIHSLNSPQIFYVVEDASVDQEIPGLKILAKFFVSATRSETSKEFFSKLFNVIGTFNWAPVSLFIFTKSLSNVPSFKCLNPRDIPMKIIVSNILATQNVSIRLACLQYLLYTVTNLIDSYNLDLRAVLDVLAAFYFDGSLPRRSKLWNHLTAWISQSFTENQVVSWMAENAMRSDFPCVFAQLVILLCDAGFLQNFDSLENLFSLLSDCDTRLYVDQDKQTRCVEILAHMVRESQSLEDNSQSFDKTRQAVLYVVEETASNIIKVFKMRLFCVESMTAYHTATKLLKCFELFCKDKEVASIFLKTKSCTSLISAAFDIVENDFQQKKINFIFAINTVNIWCKSAQDFTPDFLCERRRRILNEILKPNILVQPPFPLTSKLPPWTQEILSFVSSAIIEAEWEFVSLNISESATEGLVVQIVEAVGVALDTGGRSLLPILLKVLRKVLEKYPKSESPIAVLRDCWSNILEVRHKDIFYPALREFLRALFQPDISQTEWGPHFASECGRELLNSCESSCGVVGELALALQDLIHQKPDVIFQGPIRDLVVSCFVLSVIQRRDQKLIKKITSSISSQDDSNSILKFVRDDPFILVRCTAIEIVTFVMSVHEKRPMEIADLLVKDLLQRTETADAKRERYFTNSLTHRIQLHVLQGLMLVESKTSLRTKQTLEGWLLKRLLNENHQLSVRYLSEWLLVRICCSAPNLRNDLLQLVEAGDIRESALCSVISTLMHFSLAVQSSNSERLFFSQFFEALLPLTMSQAYSVRFHAHVAILQIWEIMEKLGLEEVKQYELSALAVQKSFYRASNKFQNHKDFYLMKFRCVEHHSLETLFYDIPRITVMTRDELIKPDLLAKIGVTETGQVPLMNKDRGLEEFNPAVNRRKDVISIENPSQSSCVQKKMVPSKWLEINEVQVKALPEVLQSFRKGGRSSHGLVVVASLLDKASNLGGLSRTCEIMGASLVLPKWSFTQDREFQALSMSSEMWTPLSEVKPHELPAFLIEMRRKGFALVGAEQTAKSTSLNSVVFPEDTVLLLGNECEGIPSNLLPLLDFCVEIPQYGLVRSLNVHVAGAIFIYEYRRQQSLANLAASCTVIDG